MWTHLTDIPNVDRAMPFVALSGKLYIYDEFENFQVYDLTLNTWATLTAPTAGTSGSFFVYAGLIYYFPDDLSVVQSYNPATNTWTNRAGYTANTAIESVQYASDGVTVWAAIVDYSDSNPNGPTYDTNRTTNLAAYTFATDSWDDGATLPVPATPGGLGYRSTFSWLPANTKGPYLIWVNGWALQDVPAGELLVLDLTDVAAGWVAAEPDPTPRSDQSQGGGDPTLNYCLVLGGYADGVLTTIAKAYDPYNDQWFALPPLLVAVQDPTVTVWASTVYLAGDTDNPGIWKLPFSDLPNAGAANIPVSPSPVPPNTNFTVHDTDGIATPGQLTISATNLPPGGAVSFRLDVNDVAHEIDTAVADDDGNLLYQRLLIDHALLEATHTIYATNVANGMMAGTFAVINDEIEELAMPDDSEPTLIPRLGVQRWYFQDPTGATPDHYIFPRNPEKYTTPYADKVISYDYTADPVHGHPITMEGAPKPVDWTFTGKLFTKDEEKHFVHWFTRPYRIFIIDHENRAYTVYLSGFDITPHQTMQHMEKRDYTMKATLYGPPVQLT